MREGRRRPQGNSSGEIPHLILSREVVDEEGNCFCPPGLAIIVVSYVPLDSM